jgi:hypothetical protein
MSATLGEQLLSALARYDKKQKEQMSGKKGKSGGAREGSGRKATGKTKVRVQFSIDAGVWRAFCQSTPSGQRSRTIEKLLHAV